MVVVVCSDIYLYGNLTVPSVDISKGWFGKS